MSDLKSSPASIVVLPTLWSGPWIWREQFSIFEAFGLDVICIPDAIVNWDVEPTLESLDKYCLEQMRSSPSPRLLVGASLGGLLALRLARSKPDLAVGVIASGCPGLGRAPGLGLGGRRSFSFDEARAIRAMLFSDATCVDDDLLRNSVAAVAGRSSAQRGVRLLSRLRAYDPGADLGRFEVPVTLIWGAHDRLSPPEPWRRFAGARAGVTFQEIADTGHVPMLENPSAFNTLLEAFLAQFVEAA